MQEFKSNDKMSTPMLFPVEPEHFWRSMREIIREEMANAEKQRPTPTTYHTPGLSQKPLYKISEVCAMFQITKPTIYDWVRHGKLKPYKIRSRVYFLWQDIQQLLKPPQQSEQ